MSGLVQKTTFPISGSSSGDATLSGVVAGNAIFVLVSYLNTGAIAAPTLSDAAGGAFAADSVPTPVNNSDGATGAGIWSKLNVAAGSHQITVSFGAATGFAEVTLVEYSGVLTAAAFDVGTSNFDNTTAGASTGGNSGTTGVTAQANELVLSALAIESGSGLANANISTPASSGYTSPALNVQQATNSNVGTEHSYKETSSAGTQIASGTWTNDPSMHSWQWAIATYKLAGGAGANTASVAWLRA